MRTFAQMDTTQTPAVVLALVHVDDQDPLLDTLTRPGFVDVTDVAPAPSSEWTFDGANWAQPPATNPRAAIQQKLKGALAANQNFLGLAQPTNAQTVAQVESLTKQVNALVRLMLGQFDSTAGT